ncbi:MAG TPA: LytTR family DNA-binding domain-containing protein [Leadbetterella sp.]|nr:LytTR family DNA-binding domain-containing protein [Leadbetterella sp.]
MKINIGSRTEIEASQMLFCVSDANYTKVFMNDGKVILTSTNLGKIEERTGNYKHLVRPNRSYLININYASFMEDRQSILLKTGKQIKISRRKIPLIMNYLDNI